MSQPVPFKVTVIVGASLVGEATVSVTGWSQKVYVDAPVVSSWRFKARDGSGEPTEDSGANPISGKQFLVSGIPLRNVNTIRIEGTEGSYPVTLWVNQW